MTDQWTWWLGAQAAAVAGEIDAYFKAHPISVDDVQSGFYETRRRNQQTGVVTRGVVAIWRRENGELCGRQDKDMGLLPCEAEKQWPYLAKRPITHAVYKAWIEHGKFPSEIEAEKVAQADGLNDIGDIDQHEMIKDRIEDLTREAERIAAKGAAKTKEEADTAANLARRLKKLEDRADVLRKEEKQPHLDAGRGVDLKWSGLVAGAAYAKNQLMRMVVTPYLDAATAARDAELAKARAEAAAKSEPWVPADPPRRITVGDASARKVGLREERTAVIDDYTKCLAYFADNHKIRQLIQQLANASAKQGTCPDGCRINIQQVAA